MILSYVITAKSITAVPSPALMKNSNTPIYCTENAVKSLLVNIIIIREWNFKTVKTGDSVDIGNGKSLVFVEMRMPIGLTLWRRT